MLSFKRIEEMTNRISRFIALIGLAGLLMLASATVLDVFMRWLFNRPIIGLNDTHSLFTAIVIASCFPLCMNKGGNITIRFIGNISGPRVKNILDAFGNLVTFVIFALMTWQLWLYTDQLARDGENTWVLNWPVSPWWRVVTIIILICVPVTLVAVIQHARSALKPRNTTDQPVSASNESEEGNT
jgi:TRAP-type transport system small permease protein